ncbi:tryptophan 2,3-dioxygenase [Alteromonas sediminis]|uniref:Tryptophan 2,3-dioxygenase n=1 Tax=Alteromonas sediminis TaxID=2259342 RepID=A0A3N5ZAK3_9ALTE|nr:tryptophan 2,3-dioxygenase family protein [Alteromonas sediminis]RPJ68174.1 tryptophan 2,3-dioxygenase [Alteromonas sediminis]
MFRKKYHHMLNNPEMLDYGVYLQCDKLLSSQKPLNDLCNADELQFQIVHQVEELWMKLIIYTLVDVLEYMEQENTHRVVTLMKRVHGLQRLMIEQLDVLETMSPKEYQQIRLQLGNGSGQESPGFRTLLKMPNDMWKVFEDKYLTGRGKTVAAIYNEEYAHDDSYVVAEALIEFDELMQKFRSNHLFLIHRSIGLGSKSLKGRPVELLQSGTRHRFFPALWDIRCEMTDRWGGEYGEVRESISKTV